MSKKIGKSVEETLKEALVPEEEQPYKVPENWVWVKIIKLIEKMELRDPVRFSGETFYYVDVESIDNKNQRVREYKKTLLSDAPSRAKRAIDKNDVIISLVRPYLKNIALIEEEDDLAVASTAFYVCRSNGSFVPKFLYNYLRGPSATAYLNEHTKGDNSPSVRNSDFENIPIPLPPLNEQKRIADKVERLLDKINQVKQLIEEAKATFELRRSAILDKAFRGELTKKWREENVNVSDIELTSISSKLKPLADDELPFDIPYSWNWYKLGEILKITSGGTPSRAVPEYYEGDIPWIKTGEIKWNDIIDSEEKISEDAIKDSSAKILPVNTVLVAMYGQGLTRGRAAILHKVSACNQAVCALLPNENVIPKFLFYFFMEGYHCFRKIAQGGNQENLSASLISGFAIPLPPIEEQTAIVSYLEMLFEKEYNISNLTSLDHLLESLINSILVKAFSGELGTNDASEEISLLNELLALKT
jgi:type I restriction enzyme S subunit